MHKATNIYVFLIKKKKKKKIRDGLRQGVAQGRVPSPIPKECRCVNRLPYQSLTAASL